MSKTNVNPNDFIMRQARRQADVERRASDASRRLGPPSNKTSFAEEGAVSPAPVVAASPSKPEFVSTTVWVEKETMHKMRKIVYDRKAAGERITMREFINRALADAIDREEGGL